jgi:hypothetical protein
MANDIQIQKTVFSKSAFSRVVDNSFRTFVQPIEEEDLDTVDELFRLYDKLYFDIDITGESNSHEFLIQKSSELLNYDAITQDIQPLLDEIAQLRTELLAAEQQILTLETPTN